MTLITNGFDGSGQTSGTTVTTGNSGGGGDTAFDSATAGTGATLAYDNTHAAHGSLACKVATGGTAAGSRVAWVAAVGTPTQLWFRSYLYFTANPAATLTVATLSNTGNTRGIYVKVNTGGTLSLANLNGGATLATTTATIPLNAFFRVEGFDLASASVGQAELKLFTTADATSPAETQTTAANLDTGADVGGGVAFGIPNTQTIANAGPFWQDDVAASTTGYIGASQVSISLAETGAATDVLTVVQAVFAETGAGADAESVAAAVPLAETGAGGGVLAVAAAVPLTETGAGTETPSLNIVSPFPALPLTIHVELLINGTWTDVTSYVYARQDITITRGRPNETSQATPSQCSLVLNNRDGRFSPRNIAGTYYPYLTRNTQLRVWLWGTADSTSVKYRFWGEVPSWPQAWDKSGNDVWTPIQAAGILRRLQQNNATLGSALYRYYSTLTDSSAPVAYWPCEDGTGSSQLASGLASGLAGTFTGGIGLASNSDVAGSDALPAVQGSTWRLPTGSPDNTISGSQTWSTAGTYSWTCPAGITSVTAQCWGPGNAGGRTNFLNTAAGGGGGAEYASDTVAVTPGSSYVVVVGQASQTPARTSTFTGDAAATVTAHGGAVGSVVTTGGAAGTGSTNATHYDGGVGGAGVFTSGVGGQGGGGGGSGGPTGAGTAGSPGDPNNAAAYNGAAAVTGGGPGGQGGSGHDGSAPPSGPGGGGGGAESGSGSLHVGGSGWDGQVTLGWATVSTGATANVARFALEIPAGGGVNGATLASIYTTGTVGRMDVVYSTGSSGNLALNGYSAAGGTLWTSGAQAFKTDGAPMLISVELTVSAGTITAKLTGVLPNATAAILTYSATTAGTVGYVTSVVVNPNGTVTDATSIGHVSVANATSTLTNFASPLGGYAGEAADVRFSRLCTEQGVPVTITGTVGDSEAMGAQADDTLINLLQACEDCDRGLIFEPRDSFGLAYRTRASLLNQDAAVVLDYPSAMLGGGDLAPTEDDALTRNDVVVTRTAGSTARAELTTGALSTASPPSGVGDYNYSQTVNCYTDAQLSDLAGWIVHLGTVDEPRYPMIPVDLARPQVASQFGAIQLVGDGDYVAVTNPPAWLPPGTIKQLAFGFTEVLNARVYRIAWNCIPESAFEVAEALASAVSDTYEDVYNDDYGTTEPGWYADTDGSTLAGAADNAATTTALQVSTASGYALWTTSDTPFDIKIGGERMTVTAISGAASPQTFTVTRGIDGTIVAHAAGTAVNLDPPPIAGL